MIYSREQALEESNGDVGRQKNVPPDRNEIILGDVAEEDVPDHLKAMMQVNLRALMSYVPKAYPGRTVAVMY